MSRRSTKQRRAAARREGATVPPPRPVPCDDGGFPPAPPPRFGTGPRRRPPDPGPATPVPRRPRLGDVGIVVDETLPPNTARWYSGYNLIYEQPPQAEPPPPPPQPPSSTREAILAALYGTVERDTARFGLEQLPNIDAVHILDRSTGQRFTVDTQILLQAGEQRDAFLRLVEERINAAERSIAQSINYNFWRRAT